MKKIMVACGTGMATSTMIASKLREFLKREGIDADVNQCQISELKHHDGKYHLFVTSMKLDSKFETPVIVGTSFLVGLNEEKTINEILAILK